MALEFVVCVKQVPKTDEVEIDEETGTIIREGVPSELNSFDEYALNVALDVKERLEEDAEEVNVTAISMGPPQAEDALIKCLAIGADRGILLTDKAFAGADTWATSLTLAKAIRNIGEDVDLIFYGYEATDGNTAQVGPETARLLSLPVLTYIEEVLETNLEDKEITCKKEIDKGYVKIKSDFPAVITCMTPLEFEPRIPGVKEIMTAKQKPLERWNHRDIKIEENESGLAGSQSQVMKAYAPPSKGPGIKIDDEPEVEAEKALKFLEDEGLME